MAFLKANTSKCDGSAPFSFTSEDLSAMTVTELKAFLKKRGKKCTGVKEELLKLAHLFVDAQVLENDGKVLADTFDQLKKKREIFTNNVIAWNRLPREKIPHIPPGFSNNKIESFLGSLSVVTSSSTGEQVVTDFNTVKPAKKGRQMYASSKIQLVETAEHEQKFLSRATVEASMRTLFRYPCVSIDSNGNVDVSMCTCEQQADGKCAHVSCLLYAIEDMAMNVYPRLSLACTSIPQVWGKGIKMSRDPKPLHLCQYTKKRRVDRIIRFDPRPPSTRHTSNSDINLFKSCLNYQRLDNSMWASMPFKYSDYNLNSSRRKVLIENINEFMKNLACQVNNFNKDTLSNLSAVHVTGSEEQAESPMWWKFRQHRITASSFKDFLNNPSRMTKKMLWEESMDLSKVPSVS